MKGMHLLEMSIAVAIIAIGLMGSLAIWANLRTLDKLTQEYNIAVHAASQKMEEILAQDWERIMAFNYAPLNSFSVKGLALQEHVTIHGLVGVETDYRLGIHVLTITVRWKDSHGNKRVVLNACKARVPPLRYKP